MAFRPNVSGLKELRVFYRTLQNLVDSHWFYSCYSLIGKHVNKLIFVGMDYSELVYAVQQGDTQRTNELCAEATVVIKKYLISKVDASDEDAADAVQEMFEYVIPKILNDEIESPTGLLSYMLTCARHKYLKIANNPSLDDYEEYSHKFTSPAQQAWKLINSEKRSIVNHCLAKMKDSYRQMAKFLLRFPDADGEELGEQFNITPNNAWARKSRALKKLTKCVRSIA